ncbi:uncharacterized protein RCC_05590 [Ramularia collo-cygni]|uniref:Uncharacterized protein n=1 Tax=Ramularia collo-cygni TaxID=112498 RepID=A0A2D3UZ78_9PEZI|nr:uncharacterized protein RCC_05590 [Ramularia collo-cygni]CZT19735.1 uncharacterized protein RCC_05590 [Ramularia collo-cygni]
METGRRTTKEPVYISAVEPALKAGAACGSVGFLFGGASGIIRGAPGFLFASASGMQTFALGSTFSLLRTTIIHNWTTDGQSPKSKDLVKASALAGGLSGGLLGFITRGRSNGIPGAIMFTIFGAGGQHIYNRWTAPKDLNLEPKKNFWKRMSERSWTPFRVLSNDEYAEMLREKVLKLDVEIAVLDDKIVALREQQAREEAAAALNPKTTEEKRAGSG